MCEEENSVYDLIDSKTKKPFIEKRLENKGTLAIWNPIVGSGKNVKLS